ncbi:hypothetical protein ACFXAZ_04775 [Streptomyces sp. NPDC059477]|uniref:hypothetical protein n=1 Tax=Streptomyces sp. NPDC059477 TaxID=3346847 RepID=UPI00369B6E3A
MSAGGRTRHDARRTRLRAGAVALAATLLAGCGISATEPVEAGGPAVIDMVLTSDNWIMVFLRSPTGGLIPSFRERPWAAPPPKPPLLVAEAVESLFEGPTAEERANGLRGTQRPLPPGQPVQVAVGGEHEVSVLLPLPLDSLDDTALRQVVCTASYSHDRRGWAQVVLRGTDGTLEATSCDVAVDVIPSSVRPSLRREGP